MKSLFITLLLLLSINLYAQLDLESIYDSAYSIGNSDKSSGITFFKSFEARASDEKQSSYYYENLAKLYARLLYPIDTLAFYYEQAHQAFIEDNEDSLAFEAIYELAIKCRSAGYYKKAKLNFERARSFAHEYSMPILEGDALNSIGITHYRNYEHAEAITYYLKAKQIYLENSRPTKTAKVYNNIGIVYKNFNNYDKAIEYYQKSIDIRKDSGIPVKFNPYFNLNNLYHFKQEPYTALSYTKEALTEAKEQKNRFFQRDVLASLFKDYMILGHYDSARQVLENHRDISEKTRYDTAIHLEKLGNYYLETSKIDSAVYVLETAIKLYKLEDDLFNTLESMTLLAEGMSKKEEYSAAINLLKEVILISEKNELDQMAFLALETLHEIYSSAGLDGLAYETLSTLKIKEDSIFNESNANIVGGVESSFDLLNEEKKNDILEEQAKSDRLQIKNQQKTILLIALGLFTSVVIGFLWFRHQKAIQELTKAELDHKNQELINFAVQITQKNELMESLNEITKKGDLGEIKEILKINRTITKDREEFENHVQSIYEGFYSRLEEKHPGLTRNDLKLAALIRMDLSSKEISTVMNISPKSVDQSRYRLRQKMKLSKEESLIESLKVF